MPTRPPGARNRVRALAVVLLAPLLLGTACGDGEPASATSPPRSSTTAGAADTTAPSTAAVPTLDANGFPLDWQPAELDWSRCAEGAGLECATLQVPLDWTLPNGEQIDLALARRPASGERIGSLLMNPGGPGASGIEYLASGSTPREVGQRFDLVSWDPRGVGASTAVTCGVDAAAMLALDPDPDDDAEQAALDAAAAAVSAGCAASDLPLLSHIGTVDVAKDLEAIRLALGDEPLNYLGYSYGTQIGQQYLQMFPTQVRAMVLDGVVDASLGFTDFLLGQTEAFDDAFEHNVDGCRAAGEGRCGVRDLGDAYDEVHERVEIEPLGSGDQVVGPAELAIAAVMTSYWDDGWEDLGPALAAAMDGNGRQLRQLAESYYDFGAYAAYAGVVCTDSPPPADAAEFERFADEARRRSPRLGGTVANEMLPCATWPVEASRAAAPVTAPGAPPVLVVGNLRDAATPYENARTVAETLESGVLVSVDIGGHTAYGVNRCVNRVVNDYLIDLVVPERDPRCT
ncbi:MAG: alpha/beta hydrolase [Microthrixaceae bacterium]